MFVQEVHMRVFGRYFLSLAVLISIAIPIAALDSQAPPLRFTKPRPYAWAGGYSVTAADLNGDGHLDLVAVNEGKVGVLLGNGDGTFKRVMKYPPGGSSPSSLAIADVNGDGKPDILVSNNYGAVGVLLGNGDGRFQPPVTYSSGGSLDYGLAVGDLNGDGYPDVAFASGVCPDAYCWEEGWCSCVGVLYNDGHGRFGAPIIDADGGYGSSYTVAIANGWLISTSDCLDAWCDWFWGNVCCGGRCYDSGGDSPYTLATGDLNGDGYSDIVVANHGYDDIMSDVGVLLWNVYGGFQPVVTYPIANPSYVAVGDVNGDGKPDIIASADDTGVLLGNGDGTFQTVVNFAWVGSNLVLGDVNGDGKLDVIGTEGIMLNHSGFLTTTHITSSLNPSFVNQSVTFTATVTSRNGLIPEGELVKFYTGTKLLASVPLSGGTATYTTSTLTAQTHIMKVKYAGDTNYAPSAGRMEQVVQ
jgi:hypothetical protein